MNLTIEDAVQPSPLAVDPNSLYSALEHVADTRKRRGKRYPLALILTLLLLGKLAGETSLQGVVEWIELRQRWLRHALNWPRRFPSLATYTRALAACDAEELAQVLAQVMLKARAHPTQQQEVAREVLRQVAVDGKTMRGTLGHHHPHQSPVHVIS